MKKVPSFDLKDPYKTISNLGWSLKSKSYYSLRMDQGFDAKIQDLSKTEEQLGKIVEIRYFATAANTCQSEPGYDKSIASSLQFGNQ